MTTSGQKWLQSIFRFIKNFAVIKDKSLARAIFDQLNLTLDYVDQYAVEGYENSVNGSFDAHYVIGSSYFAVKFAYEFYYFSNQ